MHALGMSAYFPSMILDFSCTEQQLQALAVVEATTEAAVIALVAAFGAVVKVEPWT